MPAAGAANRQATPAPSASRSRCTGPVGTAWNPGSSAGGFNWWLQRFPDAEVVVGAVLRGRPETPRAGRERVWGLVRAGGARGGGGGVEGCWAGWGGGGGGGGWRGQGGGGGGVGAGWGGGSGAADRGRCRGGT